MYVIEIEKSLFFYLCGQKFVDVYVTFGTGELMWLPNLNGGAEIAYCSAK